MFKVDDPVFMKISVDGKATQRQFIHVGQSN